MSSHEVVWYVRDRGKSGGPYTSAKIGKALRSGSLSSESEVCRADDDQWYRLADIEPFASMLDAPAAPSNQEMIPHVPTGPPELLVPPVPPSVTSPPPLPSQVTVPRVQVEVVPQTPVPPFSGTVVTRHSMPGTEHTFWEGRCSIFFYAVRFAWGGLWCAIWLIMAHHAPEIDQWVKGTAPQVIADAAKALPDGKMALDKAENVVAGNRFAQYLRWGFLLVGLWALFRLVRGVLVYFNTYYVFTSQRIKIRKGILSRKFNQVELFRLRDFTVHQTIWGRIFGYAHIEITSADRLVPWFRFQALPGGLRTAEQLREMVQQVRSQSGAIAVSE